MKCVQSVVNGKVKRVHDTRAHDMVRSGTWRYVPKSIYKGVTRYEIREDGRMEPGVREGW